MEVRWTLSCEITECPEPWPVGGVQTVAVSGQSCTMVGAEHVPSSVPRKCGVKHMRSTDKAHKLWLSHNLRLTYGVVPRLFYTRSVDVYLVPAPTKTVLRHDCPAASKKVRVTDIEFDDS